MIFLRVAAAERTRSSSFSASQTDVKVASADLSREDSVFISASSRLNSDIVREAVEVEQTGEHDGATRNRRRESRP